MQINDFSKLILEVLPQSMRVIKNEMRNCAKAELTVPQFRILVRLSQSEITNGELAEWVGVSPPTMSRMVDHLVKRNLVKRVSSENDRRQVTLSLTDAGRQLYAKIRQTIQSKLSLKVENLTSEQRIKLKEGLSVLKELFSL